MQKAKVERENKEGTKRNYSGRRGKKRDQRKMEERKEGLKGIRPGEKGKDK